MKSVILKLSVGLVSVCLIGNPEKINVEADEVSYIEALKNDNISDVGLKYEKLFEKLKKSGIIHNKCELLYVIKDDNEIILNVSESFIYIGGTYREQEVLNLIIEIGLSQPDIDFVTILVEGKVSETSEGINLYKINKLFLLE